MAGRPIRAARPSRCSLSVVCELTNKEVQGNGWGVGGCGGGGAGGGVGPCALSRSECSWSLVLGTWRPQESSSCFGLLGRCTCHVSKHVIYIYIVIRSHFGSSLELVPLRLGVGWWDNPNLTFGHFNSLPPATLDPVCPLAHGVTSSNDPTCPSQPNGRLGLWGPSCAPININPSAKSLKGRS